MALNNLGLGISFVGRDVGLSSTMGRISRGLSDMKSSATAAGNALKAGLGVGAVGGAITAGAFKLAGAAGTFEQELRRVQNISGASADALGELRDAAIEAGISTQFSPEEAVGGLVNLAAAGFNADKSMQLLTSSLNLAAAGQIGIAQSTSTVATIIKGFGLSTDEATLAVDQMVLATSRFKLQVEDLNLGLGKTIRGASLTNQSFQEMVVGLGIAKNTIVDVSEAGNSISSALLTISKKSDLIKNKLGVNVLDAQGKFKNWLDLVVEVGTASDRSFTNSAERAAFLNKAVGRFGLSAFTTTLEQIKTVASESNISLAEAADQFRASIGNAEGTAQKFADNLLDTFKGSTTLLQGTLQTLAIVIGEPFAKVLTPVVRGVTNVLNKLIQVINDMPPELKTTIATVVVVAGSIFSLSGAALLAVPAIKILMGIAAASVGSFVALAGSLLALTPIILGVGAVVAGLVVVLRSDVGGLGTFLRDAFADVALFFRAMVQLVRQGGFSGAVREEVNRAENSGLKAFAISLFRIGFRITQFFRGIREGFVSTIETMEPTIRRLRGAFSALGNAIGSVAGAGADATASIPSAKFFSAGATFGKIMARAFQVGAEALAFFIRLWAGFIRGVTSTFRRFSGVFTALGNAIRDFVNQISDLFGFAGDSVSGSMDQASNATESAGQSIGAVLAKLIVVMTAFVTFVVKVAAAIVGFFNGIKEAITGAIQGIFDLLDSALEKLRDFAREIKELVEIIPGTETFTRGIDVTGRLISSLPQEQQDVVRARISQGETVGEALQSLSLSAAPSEALSMAAAPAEPAAAAGNREQAQLMAQLMATEFRNAVGDIKLEVPVAVDGDEIFRAHNRTARDQAARGFTPIPAEEF